MARPGNGYADRCRNTKPKDKPYKLLDGKGLYLEVKPNGVKGLAFLFS
jgi:hypothetical protein